MARVVTTVLVDDLEVEGWDNFDPAGSGFDGASYEIVLSADNREKLVPALAPYIPSVPGTAPRAAHGSQRYRRELPPGPQRQRAVGRDPRLGPRDGH